MVNYETQILALIEEGNPIRDPDLLVVDQAVSTIYLATLEERSSGMTPLRTIPEKQNTRRSTMLWLAAAVSPHGQVSNGARYGLPISCLR